MSSEAGWRVIVTPRAERELKRLGAQDQKRVKRGLDLLAEFPKRGDIVKMSDSEGEWRLRVGDVRVRFRPDSANNALVVVRILRRDKAYRD